MPGANTVPGITYERHNMNPESNIPVYILIFVASISAWWLGSIVFAL
jgi:hypothetical protein